jgi:hypothetical protein
MTGRGTDFAWIAGSAAAGAGTAVAVYIALVVIGR